MRTSDILAKALLMTLPRTHFAGQPRPPLYWRRTHAIWPICNHGNADVRWGTHRRVLPTYLEVVVPGLVDVLRAVVSGCDACCDAAETEDARHCGECGRVGWWGITRPKSEGAGSRAFREEVESGRRRLGGT